MNEENSLSEAVKGGEWDRAKHLLAIRVAEMMEKTESPRETKALAISLESLIDACESADVTGNYSDTPLAQILAEAQLRKQQFRKEREEAIKKASLHSDEGEDDPPAACIVTR